MPFVSGTMKNTNTVPTTESPENSQKVPPCPSASVKFTKVFVITKAGENRDVKLINYLKNFFKNLPKSQFNVPLRDAPKPLTSGANNSPSD